MLKRVKIQGYKSLVDVEVNLQPLSVLFGPNASGKSNFLDALQLLSRIATSRTLREAFDPPYRGTPLESFTFGPNGIKDVLAQEKVSFTIEVDIELSQPVVDTLNRQIQAANGIKTIAEGNKTSTDSKTSLVREKYLRYRIEIEALPKQGTLRVANEYLAALNTQGEPTKHPPILEKSLSVLCLEGEPQNFLRDLKQSIFARPYYSPPSPYVAAVEQELATWFFHYLEPRERMRIPSPLKEVPHIGQMGEELSAFLNTLHALDERQFRALEKALHLIIPSITGIDVSVNDLGKVELNLLEGQMPIPVRLLSEGTLRTLGLLTLGGGKEPSTLLSIEEPENGIHPDRLDLITLLLKSLAYDTQVIATIHSATLLDFLPGESLYRFRQVNGKTVIDPFSQWQNRGGKPNGNKTVGNEEEIPAVSERILRGDFYA